MNRTTKLVLAGVLFLGVGLALSPLIRGLFDREERQEAVTAPEVEPKKREYGERWAQLKATAPDEISKTKKYLDKRWGHLGEEGMVAASVDADGSEVFFEKNLIVGRGPNGKTLYARAASKAHHFDGPMVKAKDRIRPSATAVKKSGHRPGSGTAKRSKPERAPMDTPKGGKRGPKGGEGAGRGGNNKKR